MSAPSRITDMYENEFKYIFKRRQLFVIDVLKMSDSHLAREILNDKDFLYWEEEEKNSQIYALCVLRLEVYESVWEKRKKYRGIKSGLRIESGRAFV